MPGLLEIVGQVEAVSFCVERALDGGGLSDEKEPLVNEVMPLEDAIRLATEQLLKVNERLNRVNERLGTLRGLVL